MSAPFGPPGPAGGPPPGWVTQSPEPKSSRRPVLIVVAILVAVAVIGAGVGWYLVHRGFFGPGGGTTTTPPATSPVSSPPVSTPPATPPVGPRNLGTRFSLPHFTVQAIEARNEGQNFAVHSRVCVLATEAGNSTIVVSAAAWAVLAGKDTIAADPNAGTYRKLTLRVGQCNEGWLVFRTGGNAVSQVLYRNSLGEAAAW